MPRNTSTRETSRRAFRTGPARTMTVAVPRRITKEPWGDLHPDHRIPTFLEAMYYEEEARVSSNARRLDI